MGVVLVTNWPMRVCFGLLLSGTSPRPKEKGLGLSDNPHFDFNIYPLLSIQCGDVQSQSSIDVQALYLGNYLA